MGTHVVTGAGSGIGRSLAEKLRDRGERLVLVVRSQGRIEDLQPDFADADFVVADLEDPASLQGLDSAVSGPLDSLIHVAGVVDLASVETFALVSWQQHLAVNLTAPAVLTQAFLPALREARGTVVFVNSAAGLSANAEWSAYAASKFGLRALADSLRAEEVDHGVRVTTVFPSRTATPMQEKVHEQEGRTYDASRWIDPATVADTILHVLDLPVDATIPDVTVRPVVPRPT